METQSKSIFRTLKIIGVLLFCVIVLAGIGKYREAQLSPAEISARDERSRQIAREAEAQDRRDQARAVCWSGLKKILDDPFSAEAESRSDWPVFQIGGTFMIGDTFIVTMTARSKNPNGAFVLGQWKCDVRIEGDQWRVVSIKPSN